MVTDTSFELRLKQDRNGHGMVGIRSTDPLMTWDGRLDTPEYHELVSRLNDWITYTINKASAIRDI